MHTRRLIGLVALAAAAVPAAARAQTHMNPLIDLLAAKKPVFGVYAPSNRGAGRGGRGGAPPADAPPPPPPKTPAQLAQDAMGYKNGDFIFDGSMEGNFDAVFPTFTEFMNGMAAAGMVDKGSTMRLHHPVIIKTHLIAENPTLAAERIGRQLNTGVSGIMFVGAESAEEVKTGLAAMRFKSQGGTRPDNVGSAPAVWGVSESEYKAKADLWPLNPKGELINWTIVESKEGLKHVREIAAVKGIGVLWPGAGTLRQVFQMRDAAGQPMRDSTGRPMVDQAGWEGAIQQVLAACKEFNVPCGYPANAQDIEMRMKQGFSVFVMNWGEPGFHAVTIGKAASGRH